MDATRREFLDDLLSTPSPSGYEARGQRVWTDYVASFADEVRTDAYGNAVAVYDESGDGPSLAFAGHADEIGLVVRRIEENGFLRVGPIGGADRTVSKGQHVTVHADEPVEGVVGQTAIHLREQGSEEYDDLGEQYVDVGATSEAEAASIVEVGDPVTYATPIRDLHGTHVAARGMDNRVGTWAAAEGLRRAVEAGVDGPLYAVSTVQEEVGRRGAMMVGFDLAVDAFVTVDVAHATDTPGISTTQQGPIELGSGPVVSRGSANHPVLVELARASADAGDVDVQLQATGTFTGTDADAFYTSRGGVPSLDVGLPNRYMHTPVEVVDTEDLTALATLLGEMAGMAPEFTPFAVDV